MLLITGAAGCGKTRLAADLARHGGASSLTIHATHYCLSRDPSATDPVRVFASLAGQLARRLPGYAAVTRDLWQADPTGQRDDSTAVYRAVLDSGPPEDAYVRALRNPLEVLASTGRLKHDVVLIVDGLDECTATSSATLTQLLAEGDGEVVPHLRVIATTRPSLLADRQAHGPARGVSSFDLTADSPDVGRDVAEFLAQTDLTPPETSALAAAAAGSLVYADLAARLSRLGRLGLGRSVQMPQGLDGMYGCIVGTQMPLARQVLGLLSRSRGDGLTPRQLTRLLGATTPSITEALKGSAAVLAGRRRIRPHHRCLGEYLAATVGDHGSAELDWLIADRLLRDSAGNWESSEEYGLRHILVHLADVGAAGGPVERRRAAARAIGDTVTDPAFLTAALANVGVDALLSGLEYVLDRAPTVAADVGRAAELLRAQAPTLRRARRCRDDGLVVQQLVYEAATIGATGIGRGLVDRVGPTSILTMWATVNTPARFAPHARAGHRSQVDDVTIMLDGERGVTSSGDGVFRVWLLASGQLSNEIDMSGRLSRWHALTDMSHIATARPDGGTDVVNIQSGERIPLLPNRTAEVSAFAVDRDGVRGISGDADGNATIWDLELGEPMLRLNCRADMVTAVDITADGWTAATGSITGSVILWDVPTGVPVHRLTCPGIVSALALTPCGKRLVVGDHDSLLVYAVPSLSAPAPTARLVTRSRVTALAVNPAMPGYVLCGTASGQVAYVRIP